MNVCQQAVQAYLDAANMDGEGVSIKAGDTITVDYIGRLADGNVFDTSVFAVAQACGKAQAGRDYSQWLSFTVGAGQMIPWFDKGVVDMKVWQTKTITIPAAEAYGEWSEQNIFPVAKKDLPNGDTLQIGDKLASSYGQVFTVHKIEGDQVMLDGNHELAGKDLIFDITVRSIQ